MAKVHTKRLRNGLRRWRPPRTYGLLVHLRLTQRGRPPPIQPRRSILDT
jgi:hypothetical protein